LLCLTLLGAPHQHGARAEPALAKPPTPEALAAAKDLFGRGLALLDADDVERALDYFLRSRALVPGKGNTANAAHCLDRLGRFDEALELYEELVTRFADELGADNQKRLVPAMSALRARVADVVVTANVDGTVLLDGRARGRLPLSGALRVLGGAHRVRVLKDGYETREATLIATVGRTARVDLVLQPLAHAGRLRLEDPTNEGAEVFVDLVQVGVAPWEGTVAPGEHVVWTASADRGSPPARAVVIQGQTATLVLQSHRLGPTVAVDVDPKTADLRLDGVRLGSGTWRGRLPVAPHEVEAAEPGYVTQTIHFEEPNTSGAPPRIAVSLVVDPRHPRWPRRPAGRIRIEAFGGLGLGRRFGSDAEAGCLGSCAHVLGGLVAGRVGIRFPFGLSVELEGGYLSVGASVARSRATTFTSDGAPRALTYELTDAVRLQGPLVGASFAWAARLPAGLALLARATAGVLFAESTDPLTGYARGEGHEVPVIVADRGELLRSALPFVEPELGIEATLKEFHLGVSLGLATFFGTGPSFSHALLEVSPAGCTHADPGAPACAPASSLVAGERAYRPFAVFLPTLSVGYQF
jgi:hypothetical protein